MANRIPRIATKLEVTFLTDTLVNKAGEKCIVEKSDHGWISEENGKIYFHFTAHLRDSNLCAIKLIS